MRKLDMKNKIKRLTLITQLSKGVESGATLLTFEVVVLVRAPLLLTRTTKGATLVPPFESTGISCQRADRARILRLQYGRSAKNRN